MLLDHRIAVIVPAFHEEALIAQVIETMPSFVDEVIVVDDGSSDGTSAVVKAIRSPHVGAASVRVIRHAKRSGVGASIVTGYRAAIESGADVLAVMAGDGQMHPDDLKTVVLPIVRGEADYVKGNRFGWPGVRSAMGFPRWLGGRVFSSLTSIAIGQRISDSQCGFTALSRRAALTLDLEGLWPSFGYPNDVLGQLASQRRTIREVDVRPLYGTEISKLRLRHLPPIFYLIARAALRRRRSSDAGADPDVTQSNDVLSGEEALRAGAAVSSFKDNDRAGTQG